MIYRDDCSMFICNWSCIFWIVTHSILDYYNVIVWVNNSKHYCRLVLYTICLEIFSNYSQGQNLFPKFISAMQG